MTSPDLIAEGRALLAAATPTGPLRVYDANEGDGSFRPAWCAADDKFIGILSTAFGEPPEDDDDDLSVNLLVETGCKADAELHAWMRNNLGTLLVMLEAAQAAIGIVQAQHETELTRIAGRQANYRREIAGLTAKVAKLEGAA